jgi:hypothetical protein
VQCDYTFADLICLGPTNGINQANPGQCLIETGDGTCYAGSQCVSGNCDLATNKCATNIIYGFCNTDSDCSAGNQCGIDGACSSNPTHTCLISSGNAWCSQFGTDTAANNALCCSGSCNSDGNCN